MHVRPIALSDSWYRLAGVWRGMPAARIQRWDAAAARPGCLSSGRQRALVEVLISCQMLQHGVTQSGGREVALVCPSTESQYLCPPIQQFHDIDTVTENSMANTSVCA